MTGGQLTLGETPAPLPVHRARFLAALLAEWARPGVAFEKRPRGERELAEQAARAALERMQDG